MKKTILCVLAGLAFSGAASASGEGPQWDDFPASRVTDIAALQRGARMFTNYCLNCHSASYMRYNRLRDIGLTEQQIKDNLVFTGAKVGDQMRSPLDPKEAKDWFGAVPPDLTLITRSRAEAGKGSGADYLYTYLRSFYRDDTKATGWNNTVFPNVAMPNALWQLQGQQRAVFEDRADPHEEGKTEHAFRNFETMAPGQMTTEEFNTAVADLVAFMQWMSEPVQTERVRLGIWVLIFLGVFTVIAWRLNAAYWKDIG
jgi:ubiquinol-cytochrome c reductase cytochrome c1 subunit